MCACFCAEGTESRPSAIPVTPAPNT